MKNVQNALRKVLVPLNHFVHRIVLLIAQISMMAMVAIVTLTVVLRPVVGGRGAAPAGDAVRLYRLRHRRARPPACGRQRGVQPAPGRRQGAQGARRADGRGGAAVRPVHALHRRRAHDEALQHAGHAAHHRYFDRVAVSADPDCGLCDYV